MRIKCEKPLWIAFMVLLMISFRPSELYAQPGLAQIFPNQSVFKTGESIRIRGFDLWHGPGPTSCDTLTLLNTSTLIEYHFLPAANVTDSTYNGVDLGGPNDTIYFTIPVQLPCGSYRVLFQMDSTCVGPLIGAGGALPCGSFGEICFDIQDSLDITYPGLDTFCLGDNNPIPISTLDTAIFSTPFGGGQVDSVTGELLITSTSIGTVDILAISDPTNPVCSDTASFTLVVDSMRAGPGILYTAGTPYCPLDSFAVPLTGPGDSTFGSIPALQWASQDSGIIDLVASNAGNFAVIYYPPHNQCTYPDTTGVTITAIERPIFDYLPQYCEGDTSPVPLITYIPGGIFVEDTTQTTGLVIDPVTGAIDLDSSTTGQHFVGYIPSALQCADSSVLDTINIYNTVEAFMEFDPDSVCAGQIMTGPNLSTLVPPLSGSPYFHDTTGAITIDSATGQVDIQSSTQGGPYYVFYVNGDPICPDSFAAPLMILPQDSFDIFYPNSTYCATDNDPPAIFASGPTGGEFIWSTTGPGPLIMNDSTGQVDLDASNAGTYLIRYVSPNTECRDTVVVDSAFTIDPVGDATFALPNNPIDDTLCQGSGLIAMGTIAFPSPTSGFIVTGPNGAIPNAVVNDSIDTDVIPPGGPYPITRYVNNGVCVDSFTNYLTILPRDDASFYYVEDTICNDANDPFPLILGTSGGTFSVLPGDSMVVSGTTGQIDLSSALGTHAVVYTTNGLCPDTDTTIIRILPSNSASFVYAGQPRFCSNRADSIIRVDSVNFFFEPGGIFTYSSQGGGVLALNDSTGNINIDSSDFDIFTVTYSLTSSVCDQVFNNTFSIVAADDTTTMAYPQDIYCPNDNDPTPVVNGDPNGIFLAPPGINFSDTQGTIDLQNSVPGQFLIRYDLGGQCEVVLEDSIEIQDQVLANFDYGRDFFCNTDSNPIPSISSGGGGNFSVTDNFGNPFPQLIDSLTGQFYLDQVTQNNIKYVISYVPNSGCTDTSSRIITVFQGPTGATLDPSVVLPICEGQELTFAASGSETGYTWFVNGQQVPPDSLGSNAATFQSSTFTDSSRVEVVFGNLANCFDTLSRVVPVFPNPVIGVTDTSITVSGDQEVTIPVVSFLDQTFMDWTATSAADIDYSATVGQVGPVDNGQTAIITNQLSLADSSSPALVVFEVTPTTNGCDGEPVFVYVRVNPNNQGIFVPELITPNGDNLNDEWLIQWRNGLLPENYTMLLFNRAGGQVLRMSPLNQNFTGDQLPDGIYWYKLIDNRTSNVLRTGGLTIRRK